MLEQLFPFLAASILLTIIPGPDITYVLVQSIAHGRNKGIATAFGLASGVLVHTSLVAFGVSVIISSSENMFFGIKLLGASYLFFLAFKVYKSPIDMVFSAENVPEKSGFSLFRQGFIMNVLNPKVILFFLAFFPGFLWDKTANTIFQFYSLGFIFIGQVLLIFGTIAFLGGKIADYLQQHKNSGHVLKWLQIVVFIAIGGLILLPS